MRNTSMQIGIIVARKTELMFLINLSFIVAGLSTPYYYHYSRVCGVGPSFSGNTVSTLLGRGFCGN